MIQSHPGDSFHYSMNIHITSPERLKVWVYEEHFETPDEILVKKLADFLLLASLSPLTTAHSSPTLLLSDGNLG